MKKFSSWKYFKWKILILRVLINTLIMLAIVIFFPDIYVVQRSLIGILILGAALGILNAIIKPIIQFLTLRFIFASYGLVVVLTNTLLLYILSWIFPGLIQVINFWWALLAGAVIGLLGSFLETLFGVTAPILPEEQVELRRRAQIEERTLMETLLAKARKNKEDPVKIVSEDSLQAIDVTPGSEASPQESPSTPAAEEGSR